MPLYEYQCDACHHRFEVIQKFADPPVEKCPNCGGTVRKLLSSPAIQFKGTGWYVTDYSDKRKSEGSTPAGKTAEGEGKGKDQSKDKTASADSSTSAATPAGTASSSKEAAKS